MYSHKFIGIGGSPNEVPAWAQALGSVSEHGDGLRVALEAIVKWELAAHQVKHHVGILVHLLQSSLHKRKNNKVIKKLLISGQSVEKTTGK